MSTGPHIKRRQPPFSLRLSADERAALESRAGSLPLASYIKLVLFGPDGTSVRRPRPVSADQALLAKVLAALGASRLASNLNQLAKLAHIGVLPVTQETEVELRRACADVGDMRALLMTALGIQQKDDKEALEGAAAAFNAAGREVSS